MLGDLAAKVEELEAAVAEAATTRATLKAAFSDMARSLMPRSGEGGGSGSGAAPSSGVSSCHLSHSTQAPCHGSALRQMVCC